jgi:arylsulfatase A-like enzyme/Flp pilus assembly protein TadD
MLPTVLMLSLLCGCSQPSSPDVAIEEVARTDLPNVVLISLDTTRADRIGAYGYEKAVTPNLDALAAAGRRYARAYSPVPLTIPSHGAIFTGRYPSELGVRTNGDAVIRADEQMLAEVLHEAGYATVASVGAFVTGEIWGFNQGFDAYYDDVVKDEVWHAERPCEEVVDDIDAWMAERPADHPGPIFAWVHLFDAHMPYHTGEPWLSAVGGHPYDAELSRIDDQIGRIRRMFEGKPTIFVVVGDHGEGLGEHRELTHGLYTYDATQRVPFVLSGPGVDAGVVVDMPVSLVDVAPTLLAHLKLPALSQASGRVVPNAEPSGVYMESYTLKQRFGIAPHVALVEGDHKVIDLPIPELYNVVDDPGELTNLAADDPDRVDAMVAALRQLDFEPPSIDPSHPKPGSTEHQLEMLGYVDGGFLGDPTEIVDPKEKAEMLRLTQVLVVDHALGKREHAAIVVRQLAHDYPDVAEFQTRLAMVQSADGKVDKAVATLRHLLARDPKNVQVNSQLAAMLREAHEPGEASIRFQQAAEDLPHHPRLRAHAVGTLFELHDLGQDKDAFDQAVALGKVYLHDFPEDYQVAGVLGVRMAQAGNVDIASKLLEHGNLSMTPEPEVALLLAAIATGKGEISSAIQLLKRELEHHPTSLKASLTLGKLQLRQSQAEQAVTDVRAFREGPGRRLFALADQRAVPDGAPPLQLDLLPTTTAPGLVELWWIEAQGLYNQGKYAECRTVIDHGYTIMADASMLLMLEANLLKQEGKRDEAVARFEQAKAAKIREDAAALAAEPKR